jgi:hypothetical protein
VSASTEVLIGDAGGPHVLIRVLFRNHPGLFDAGDGNWLGCEIEIAAGAFRGAFPADLRAEEFKTFFDEADALSRALDGIATLSTIEEQIALTLSGDGKGHVRVQGDARDAPAGENRLHFGFDIDQTYLQEICRSLEIILSAFPVVGAGEGQRQADR